MTDERPSKRAADDVAKDMRRRLDELDEHVHDAERQVAAVPQNPLSRIAGDPEAIHEGPHSAGGTLGGSRRKQQPGDQADDEEQRGG